MIRWGHTLYNITNWKAHSIKFWKHRVTNWLLLISSITFWITSVMDFVSYTLQLGHLELIYPSLWRWSHMYYCCINNSDILLLLQKELTYTLTIAKEAHIYPSSNICITIRVYVNHFYNEGFNDKIKFNNEWGESLCLSVAHHHYSFVTNCNKCNFLFANGPISFYFDKDRVQVHWY